MALNDLTVSSKAGRQLDRIGAVKGDRTKAAFAFVLASAATGSVVQFTARGQILKQFVVEQSEHLFPFFDPNLVRGLVFVGTMLAGGTAGLLIKGAFYNPIRAQKLREQAAQNPGHHCDHC